MHYSVLLTAFFAILLFVSPLQPRAQSISTTRWSVPVQAGGQQLDFAWAGGLNNPQVSEADLDRDGLNDLFIFDRTGDAQLAFRNAGNAWVYAPELLQHFPTDLAHWVMLRDYDGDGVQDLFAYSDAIVAGIRVYRGYYGADDRLHFDRYNFNNELNIIFFPLSGGGKTQIYVSTIDYPAIDDLDCDGDLDILTFNISGGYVEFYRNQSVEMGYQRDSLLFRLADNCWGNFYESGITNELDLSPNPDQCAQALTGPADEALEFRHAGSTLLTFDNNGDGLKDLLLGDLSFPEANLATNTGTCSDAFVTAQDPNFPSYDVPIDIPLFPATFLADVNFDGRPDLLAAPNLKQNAENVEVLWYYANTGTAQQPVFDLQTRSFLVGDMIDHGTGARPVPFDYNADGLMDLVIGNSTFFAPQAVLDSRLFLYENTGTAGAPRFRLVDEDYLGLQQYNSTTFEFAPCFADLDGDGDQDALIGEQTGGLILLENTAGAGQPAQFGPPQFAYAGIDVGISSVPFVADLNRDGLPDLLIGERSGNINFFPNQGTPGNPVFTADQTVAPNVEIFGGIDTRVPGFSTGYSAPWVADTDEGFLLFTGSRTGAVEVYGPFTENELNGDLPLLTERLDSLYPGERTLPALHDWNNDNFLDLVIGNLRGGVSLYQTDLPAEEAVPVAEPDPLTAVRLYPNPAGARVWIEGLSSEDIPLQLWSATGQLIARWSSRGSNRLALPLDGLPAGLYFLQPGKGRPLPLVRE